MYVVLDVSNIDINNVFYLEKVKNTVMDNSNFLRVVYSNEFFTLNGIFVKFNLNLHTVEKSFNKYKCLFDSRLHQDIIAQISSIEKNMLHKQAFIHKLPICRISEQLNNGYLKIFNETVCKDTNEFILKIYGLWENDYEYGLTYKFITL
jgi:hypothetical protein